MATLKCVMRQHPAASCHNWKASRACIPHQEWSGKEKRKKIIKQTCRGVSVKNLKHSMSTKKWGWRVAYQGVIGMGRNKNIIYLTSYFHHKNVNKNIATISFFKVMANQY